MFDEVNSGWLISYIYSEEWVNQLEIKDTCIEFVINNIWLQGNNAKIKLTLKVKEIGGNVWIS